MGDFEPRPKGTVMYGEFADLDRAERALRVLQNAGYGRAEVAIARALPGDPVVVVVDAAPAGAVRAAEILEEYGAQLRSSLPRVERLPEAEPVVPLGAHVEPKPRVRKRIRQETSPAATRPPPDQVAIVTRNIDLASVNQSSRAPSAPPAPNTSQPMLP